jgi:hypothetical protein
MAKVPLEKVSRESHYPVAVSRLVRQRTGAILRKHPQNCYLPVKRPAQRFPSESVSLNSIFVTGASRLLRDGHSGRSVTGASA